MEDPAREIQNVALLATAAVNSEIQKETVLKYYAPDVSFRHPLCTVPAAPQSRTDLLAILQWYRILSPMLLLHVNDVTYDKNKNSIFLDITQTFHIRWSPLRPAPARLIVHLKLRPEPSPTDSSKTVYLIAEQEDFYHPEDLAALVVPPFIPLVRGVLRAATFACKVNAKLFEMLGFWAAGGDKGGRGPGGIELQPEEEPLPPAAEAEAFELQEISADKKKD